MFFTNKEKNDLLLQIEELKNKIELRDLNYEKLSYISQHERIQKEGLLMYKKEAHGKILELTTKSETLEVENAKLKAQNIVLAKIQDKEDEYKDEIHRLDKELTVAQNDFRTENEKTQKLAIEVDELKSERKELIEKIFAFTTKEPTIIRPELVTPTIVEPTFISKK